MALYTLTYSEASQGWPSFYSFYPDWMIGMNQFFYSFKGGNIYKHNVNPLHNTFYGVFTPSKVVSVFNDEPLQNKLFKTINLESDLPWETNLETDIQVTGFIDKDWYEKKEQSWYAFVRNLSGGINDYVLRSLNGIGQSAAVAGPVTATVVSFANTISIGSIISVGDSLYYSLPPYTSVVFCGTVTQVNVNLPGGINDIVVNASLGSIPPIQDALFLYLKDPVAESHGVLGHYCKFEIENDSTAATELYAVEAEVMKSYP